MWNTINDGTIKADLLSKGTGILIKIRKTG